MPETRTAPGARMADPGTESAQDRETEPAAARGRRIPGQRTGPGGRTRVSRPPDPLRRAGRPAAGGHPVRRRHLSRRGQHPEPGPCSGPPRRLRRRGTGARGRERAPSAEDETATRGNPVAAAHPDQHPPAPRGCLRGRLPAGPAQALMLDPTTHSYRAAVNLINEMFRVQGMCCRRWSGSGDARHGA